MLCRYGPDSMPSLPIAHLFHGFYLWWYHSWSAFLSKCLLFPFFDLTPSHWLLVTKLSKGFFSHPTCHLPDTKMEPIFLLNLGCPSLYYVGWWTDSLLNDFHFISLFPREEHTLCWWWKWWSDIFSFWRRFWSMNTILTKSLKHERE